jgi:hypothetical protein
MGIEIRNNTYSDGNNKQMNLAKNMHKEKEKVFGR